MRLAVIGTPRSGNSLLRKVLSHAYGLGEVGSHDPEYLLGDLPDNTVFQVHAACTPQVQASLRRQGVLVVTPTRHPLDTLLSMLHFAQFEPEVDRWLGGEYLADLPGCDPTSRAFREFALGEGAGALLGVSVGWAPHADVVIDYTESATEPLTVLAHEGLGAHRIVGDAAVMREVSAFDAFHRTGNMHGWLGRAGYWTSFIPGHLAADIQSAHSAAFAVGGYGIDGAADLAAPAIRMAWAQSFSGGRQEQPVPPRTRRWSRMLVNRAATF